MADALKRRIGLGLLTAYGVGVMVGAGIYVLVGAVAAEAGIWAPLSFVMAGIIADMPAAIAGMVGDVDFYNRMLFLAGLWIAIRTFNPDRRPSCLAVSLLADAEYQAYRRRQRQRSGARGHGDQGAGGQAGGPDGAIGVVAGGAASASRNTYMAAALTPTGFDRLPNAAAPVNPGGILSLCADG